jgi:hypothetical protein
MWSRAFVICLRYYGIFFKEIRNYPNQDSVCPDKDLKLSPLDYAVTLASIWQADMSFSCSCFRTGYIDFFSFWFYSRPRRSSNSVCTSPTSDGRSVGIVRSRTHAMDFLFCEEIMQKERVYWYETISGARNKAPFRLYQSYITKWHSQNSVVGNSSSLYQRNAEFIGRNLNWNGK